MKNALLELKKAAFFLALLGSLFSNSACGIGLGIYLGALLLEAFLGPKYEWQPYPFRRLFCALLLSLAVSVAISGYFWVSFKGYGKYLEGFLLLYAALDVLRSESDKNRLLFLLLAMYAVAVVSAIYQQLTGADLLRGYPVNIYQGSSTRLTGPFKHCNDFGTFLVPGFTLALALFMSGKKVQKLLAAALFAALCFVLARTLSRGAMVSAFAAVLFFCFFFRIRWIALGSSFAALIFVWLSPSTLGQRLREMTNLNFGESSERLLLLQTTFSMLAQNPVFGLGLNTYSDNFLKFKPADYPGFMYSHNSYAQMAAEAGLLGTGLFIAFLAAVMTLSARVLLKQSETSPARVWGLGLLAGAFGILVNCLFESALQSTRLRFLFWALLGSAVALSRLSVKPSK